MSLWAWLGIGLGSFLAIVALYDVTQKKHAVLRNFPVVGHFRYWLEAIGPELRQYIVTSNDEERPFSRDQREWVYSSAHGTGSYVGFGTDNEVEQSPNYVIIKQAAFPLPRPPAEEDVLPCAKVLGAARDRAG